MSGLYTGVSQYTDGSNAHGKARGKRYRVMKKTTFAEIADGLQLLTEIDASAIKYQVSTRTAPLNRKSESQLFTDFVSLKTYS